MSSPASTVLPERLPIEIVLPIEGMTCASCVNRIERFLTRTPGVEHAAVNLATERATVSVDPAVAGRDELVRAVEAAGYEVRPDRPAAGAAGGGASTIAAELTADDVERERAQRTTLVQAVAAIAVALGIMLVMFLPQTAVGLEALNRLVLWPATLIQFWAGGRFYRAAWRAGRHGSATMDTLVAVGTTAAWGYSMVVTLWPEVVVSAGIEPVSYFDSSAIIIGLVLLGRWLEGRAKGRTTGAIRHLVGAAGDHGPADPRRRGGRRASCRTSCPATCSGCAPATRCRSTGSSSRGPRRSTSRCSPASRSPSPRRPATRSSGPPSTPPARSSCAPPASGRDTALARIVELVERAQGSKAPIQRLADRVSEVFVPLVLVVASLTFVAWMLVGPEPRFTLALTAFIGVVIIACPCAMGLATPDRDHGRDGEGRRGRDPGPRRRGARDRGARRHGRARQDRHADPRPPGGLGRRARGGLHAVRAARPGGLARDGLRTPAGRGHRPARPRDRARVRDGRRLRGDRGPRRGRDGRRAPGARREPAPDDGARRRSRGAPRAGPHGRSGWRDGRVRRGRRASPPG